MDRQTGESWKGFIAKLKPKVRFNSPATADQIEFLERTLRVRIDADLYNLLLESNGIEDWLLSTEQIISENIEHRTEPMFKKMYPKLDDLMFFLRDGTGSFYAYAIDEKTRECRDTLYWCHEADERSRAGRRLAETIQSYLR